MPSYTKRHKKLHETCIKKELKPPVVLKHIKQSCMLRSFRKKHFTIWMRLLRWSVEWLYQTALTKGFKAAAVFNVYSKNGKIRHRQKITLLNFIDNYNRVEKFNSVRKLNRVTKSNSVENFNSVKKIEPSHFSNSVEKRNTVKNHITVEILSLLNFYHCCKKSSLL